jgi:hypothetical protein
MTVLLHMRKDGVARMMLQEFGGRGSTSKHGSLTEHSTIRRNLRYGIMLYNHENNGHLYSTATPKQPVLS